LGAGERGTDCTDYAISCIIQKKTQQTSVRDIELARRRLQNLLRVRNPMKRACVAARIGDGKAHGAGNSHSIAKTSNAASRGGRSRFQVLFAWMRPRSATLSAPNPRDLRTPTRSHPRKQGPYSALRCAADSGYNPSGWHEFWPGAPGSRRKGFVVGAETGAQWRMCVPWATSPFPQTGLRLTSHGATLSQATCLE
jgi:hypothetical protein